jgi:hypothetical protein
MIEKVEIAPVDAGTLKSFDRANSQWTRRPISLPFNGDFTSDEMPN